MPSPAAKRLPSGGYATAVTAARSPPATLAWKRGCTSFGGASVGSARRLNTCTRPPSTPHARWFPSGENAMERTGPPASNANIAARVSAFPSTRRARSRRPSRIDS